MGEKSWQYDEMKQLGTDYENNDEIKNYDTRMAKIRDANSELSEITGMLNLDGTQTLIEFGCGTGEFAIRVSGSCSQVYALDVSRPMLDYAGEKARLRAAGPIKFINSGFLNYSHDTGPFDAAVSQLALHHLPDFWKQIALVNVHSLLKPGGLFYLRDIVFSLKLEKYETTIDWTIKNFKETAGADMASKFSDHIKNEYSTFDWTMEELIYRAGFEIEMADYRDNFMAVYLCRKPLRQ